MIERENNEVVFRVSGVIDVDDLQDIADFLEFKEIARNSKAVQEDVDELAKTVKKGRWGEPGRKSAYERSDRYEHHLQCNVEYSEYEFKRVFNLFARKIGFVDRRLISSHFYQEALSLTKDVDVSDTEFVALTLYLNGKLWSRKRPSEPD